MELSRRALLLKSMLPLVLPYATPLVAQNNNQTVVRLSPYNYQEYRIMLNGRQASDIPDFKELKNLNRQMLEPWIFEQAVHKGGFSQPVIIDSYSFNTSYARTVLNINTGVELTHPIAGFDKDPYYDTGNFLLSTPILSGEDFQVGFYTHEDRHDVLSARTEEDIRKLRFVHARNWLVDEKVLEAHGFERVAADGWRSLLLLINAKRADVVLQPFRPTHDMGFRDTSTSLYMKPIPNLKMRFGVGRSYMVSKLHPLGNEMFATLNRGIALLSQNNFLRDAHIAAGVLDARADNFKMLFTDFDIKKI